MDKLDFGTIVPILSVLILFIVIVKIASLFKGRTEFFTKGYDSGFKSKEIRALWRLAKECNLKEPLYLYSSVPTLNDCIGKIITRSRKTNTYNSKRTQDFLKKLYDFRTRVALTQDAKRNLTNSAYLDEGQKLSIILPGKGVFNSVLVRNAHSLTISLPKRRDKKTGVMIIPKIDEWLGQNITVYLWRKGDAMYSFKSFVTDSGIFLGNPTLLLKQSGELVRNQKRQSIRSECRIYATMFMIKSHVIDYEAVDTEGGFRCFLEDISEDGALIRVGGKGVSNVQIKLQFELEDTFIMMFGVVKAVEYNSAMNQSRLHFECLHIEPSMKNAILSYVYKIVPESERNVQEALKEAEEEEEYVWNADEKSNKEAAKVVESSRINMESLSDSELIGSEDDLKEFEKNLK